MVCLIFQRLPSTNFTWSTLEYFVPHGKYIEILKKAGTLAKECNAVGVKKMRFVGDTTSLSHAEAQERWARKLKQFDCA